MTLSKDFLEKIKNKLTEEQTRIQGELERIGKPSEVPGEYETRFNDIGTDEDENASEVEEYTDNLALEKNLEGQLKDINEALVRIEDGTYGFCENCQQEIDPERLLAYPSAKTCIKCK